MNTQAAYLKSPWQVELRAVTLPDTPPTGWLLLRVDACGVCGTDLTAAVEKKDWGAFGHEIAGTVERVGDGVANVAAGQRVVLESSSYCGTCANCRNGRVDLCHRAPNFWKQPALGFSQFMLAPACAAVPYDGLPAEQACLAEPAGVAYDMVKVAGIQLGDRVCVVGPGPIGLMAVALAKAAGAVRVTCVGRSRGARRLAVARDLGAEVVACDGALSEQKTLAKAFDHVLLTAPVEFIPPALALLDYEGRLTFIGIGHGDPKITFDANDFHFRKLQLRASFAAPAVYFPRVLALAQAGVLPLAKLVSHVFPLAEIAQAMQTGRDDKAGTLKIVVRP